MVFRDLSIELGQLELTKGPGTEFALEDAPSISIRCQGIKNECHTITEDVSKTEGVLHFNYKEKMMVRHYHGSHAHALTNAPPKMNLAHPYIVYAAHHSEGAQGKAQLQAGRLPIEVRSASAH